MQRLAIAVVALAATAIPALAQDNPTPPSGPAPPAAETPPAPPPSDTTPPPPPPPPPGRGPHGPPPPGPRAENHFRIEKGRTRIDVHCVASESLQNCLEATLTLLDRASRIMPTSAQLQDDRSRDDDEDQ